MNFPNSRHNCCPGTHRARFFSNKKLALIESPIPNMICSNSDRNHLCMSSRIILSSGLIMCRSDNVSFVNHYSTDRNFVRDPCAYCFIVSMLNEEKIIFLELGRKDFRKWTVGSDSSENTIIKNSLKENLDLRHRDGMIKPFTTLCQKKKS